MQVYKTIEKEAFDEFYERKSRFIGYVKPVKTEEESLDFLNNIRTKHWNAKHNTYAYSLRENTITRYSDDSEPQGTAGLPILDVIKRSEITDVIVVVTRYFGGILLGTGGLVRAYSHAAKIAIEAGKIIDMQFCIVFSATCEYSQYGKIKNAIIEFSGVVEEELFEDKVTIIFYIPEIKVEEFSKKFSDITCGQVILKELSKKFKKI